MFRRAIAILVVTLAFAAAYVLPAHAVAGSFRVPASSEYGVKVWDGANCQGYSRTIAPGGSRNGSRVRSFKVYAKKGAYKLNSGSWRTAYTARCYNVNAAIVYAKAWD